MRIAIAALSIIVSASPLSAQQQTTQPTSLVRLAAALNGPESDAIDAISKDCSFDHPEDDILTSSCEKLQSANFRLLKRTISGSEDRDRSMAIAMGCMSGNKNINGFDWKRVTQCYKAFVASESNHSQ